VEQWKVAGGYQKLMEKSDSGHGGEGGGGLANGFG